MRNSQSPKISSGTYRTVEVPTTGFLSSHRTNFWLAIHPPRPPALAHGMHPSAMVAGAARTLDVGPLSAGSSRARGESHETHRETDRTQASHSHCDGSLLPARESRRRHVPQRGAGGRMPLPARRGDRGRSLRAQHERDRSGVLSARVLTQLLSVETPPL